MTSVFVVSQKHSDFPISIIPIARDAFVVCITSMFILKNLFHNANIAKPLFYGDARFYGIHIKKSEMIKDPGVIRPGRVEGFHSGHKIFVPDLIPRPLLPHRSPYSLPM